MTDRILYDLAGANSDVRFSPFCWLAKFGLLHKGLEFETVALNFQPKSAYPDADYGKLPMLKDQGKLIKDSAQIIEHLESTYPEAPFVQGEAGAANLEKTKQWTGEALFPALAPLLMHRVAKSLNTEDEAYFRETREKNFGTTLENLAEADDFSSRATTALKDLSQQLGDNQWLSGEGPGLSDYVAASPLMWQKSITNEDLYEVPAPVARWFERVQGLFDGYGRKAACAGC